VGAKDVIERKNSKGNIVFYLLLKKIIKEEEV